MSLFVLLVAGSAACGGDDGGGTAGSSGGAAGSGDMSCSPDTPELTFGPTGLGAANEMLGVKVYVVDASDRPPTNGSNDWTIQFTDMMGNDMPTANLTYACAWMAQHGHGSNPKVVENLGGGKYKLDKQNMAMQGDWQIKLWVDPTGGGTTFTGINTPALNRDACSGPTSTESLSLKACVPR